VSGAARPSDLIHSRDFVLRAMRSERTRTVWMIVALALLMVVVVLRHLLVDAAVASRILTSLSLGGGMMAYEALRLVLVNGRLRRSAPMPAFTWPLNVTIESLFPTLIVLVMTLMPDVGPYAALVMPGVFLYFLIIVLSTLRLSPALAMLSGAVSGVGYGAMVAYTFITYETPDFAFPVAVYVTGAAFMVITGFAAAAVASQIRTHVATALREAQERQRLELKARNTLIFGLAKLAEYRDTDTGAHLERISTYAALLAKAMEGDFEEIDDEWIETLRVAASMHDIGKVGVPDSVLLKPGRLTDEERSVMEGHPAIGAETLRAIQAEHGDDPLLAMSDAIAIGHHERWDGTGYPNRVPGPEIALAARIISVADVYDALTSARVYKPPFPHEKASAIIVEGRGTQFDPDVVDAFSRIADEFDAVRGKYVKEATGDDASGHG
jgi:putative two-component system response regulator